MAFGGTDCPSISSDVREKSRLALLARSITGTASISASTRNLTTAKADLTIFLIVRRDANVTEANGATTYPAGDYPLTADPASISLGHLIPTGYEPHLLRGQSFIPSGSGSQQSMPGPWSHVEILRSSENDLFFESSIRDQL